MCILMVEIDKPYNLAVQLLRMYVEKIRFWKPTHTSMHHSRLQNSSDMEVGKHTWTDE